MSADGPCVNFPAAVPAAPKPCPSSKVPAAVVEAIEKGDVAAVEKWFADDSAADPNALCEDGWSLLVRAASEEDPRHHFALIHTGFWKMSM